MSQVRRVYLRRLPYRILAFWRRDSAALAASRWAPCANPCRSWNAIIAFDCVTSGLRISSCMVGGNSSPNHMSSARCIVKNFSGGNGHQRLLSSDTTVVSLIMKARIPQ